MHNYIAQSRNHPLKASRAQPHHFTPISHFPRPTRDYVLSVLQCVSRRRLTLSDSSRRWIPTANLAKYYGDCTIEIRFAEDVMKYSQLRVDR